MFQILYEISYTLPAFFIIFFFREWFRSYLFRLLSYTKTNLYKPYVYIDIWAIVVGALFNISWGGMLQKHENRKDNVLTFLLSQIFLLAFFLITYIYIYLNNPEVSTYWYELLHKISHISYILFIVNFIPLPPFDASFFYLQKILHFSLIYFIVLLFRGFLIILLFLEVLDPSWLLYEKLEYFLKSIQ